MAKQRFEIEFLPQAEEFLGELPDKVRKKLIQNMRLSQEINDPERFKKLNDHIWEFRAEQDRIAVRLLAFLVHRDNQLALVVCAHGFIKKSQKTPPKEIKKAETLRREYLSQMEDSA